MQPVARKCCTYGCAYMVRNCLVSSVHAWYNLATLNFYYHGPMTYSAASFACNMYWDLWFHFNDFITPMVQSLLTLNFLFSSNTQETVCLFVMASPDTKHKCKHQMMTALNSQDLSSHNFLPSDIIQNCLIIYFLQDWCNTGSNAAEQATIAVLPVPLCPKFDKRIQTSAPNACCWWHHTAKTSSWVSSASWCLLTQWSVQ